MIYIDEAYKEAEKALKINEVPVGAVIVKDNIIIARAYNKKEKNNDPLGHCELIAIRKACKKISSWRLLDCDMYVTLEPCAMCMGAIVHARIRNVYYGVKDSRFGAAGGSFNLLETAKLNHTPYLECLNDSKCGKILKDFFAEKRK